MTRHVETEHCEHCGNTHEKRVIIYCDACQGAIVATEPRTVEWFHNTGVYSKIEEYIPTGELSRAPITVTYEAKRLSGSVFQFHFCCLAHMLAFLRNLPDGYLPIDEIKIEGLVHAFAQLPVQEIPEPSSEAD